MSVQLHIIEETADWIAVDKPASIQVERNPFGHSVESLVYAHLQQAARNPYVGIVHRLDRVTTGVVLVAKRKQVLRELNQQFSQKDIRKAYRARVIGVPEQLEGVLSHWLIKDLKGKRAVAAEEGAAGAKLCEMGYRLIAEAPEGQAVLELYPTTGRYHQLRAQLSAVGLPIVGDTHYGGPAWEETAIMLQASALEFFDKARGERHTVEAPLPKWAGKGQ